MQRVLAYDGSTETTIMSIGCRAFAVLRESQKGADGANNVLPSV